MNNIQITENFGGYIAYPSSYTNPVAAVVVLQEIFGVNNVMQQTCDKLAENGYIAICPDLFYKLEPNIELTDKTDEDWQKAFSLLQKFDPESAIQDIQATIDFIRSNDKCNDKVGAIGFCLGGQLAYYTACHTNIDASVSYYGIYIQDNLHRADNLKNPLMLHIAGEDKFVPHEEQDKIISYFENNPLVEIYRYEGVDHAFARIDGITADKDAAKLANQRTGVFLAKQLQNEVSMPKAIAG